MENKINIAELLKDCPQGMELDCTLFEGLEFDGIVDNEYLPIRCRVKNPNGGYNVYNFTKYGCWIDTTFAKCVIFPKGKTTWEGFQRPFKDGDILSYQYEDFTNRTIYIYMQHSRMNTTYYVALSGNFDSDFMINDKEEYALNGYNDSVRLATEEEKEKLFQAIKDNGYRWNAETKTLEKLVEPKFKVGDRIRHKEKTKWVCTIARVEDRYYVDGHPMCFTLPFGKQNDYELVPNKFDINTLKPYQKVLFRQSEDCIWLNSFFGFYDKNAKTHPFICCNGFAFKYCIPYEKNEHLLGTTNDCDEYIKTWE